MGFGVGLAGNEWKTVQKGQALEGLMLYQRGIKMSPYNFKK